MTKEQKKKEQQELRSARKAEKKQKQLERRIAYYEKKKAKEASGKKNVFQQFKAFITRGNIVDMAVGVILATAFTAIINALVNNIFMPLINAAFVKANFEFGFVTVLTKHVVDGVEVPQFQIEWGVFFNAIISFLLIALILFTIVKVIQTMNKIKEKAKADYEAKLLAEGVIKPEEPEPEPEKMATNNDIAALLVEIRDSLKDKPKK